MKNGREGFIQNATAITKFENHSEVLVENQQIATLCPSILKIQARSAFGSFKEFLEERNTRVQIINCSVTAIEPGSYIYGGILGSLKISRNKIFVLHSGIFNGMPVRVLDLSYNALREIESSAFENSTLLEYLILKGNFLQEVDPAWFKNLVNLRSVNLAENRLVDVKKIWFTLLMDHRISINLAYNKIAVLENELFSGFCTVDSLLLQGNKLKTLPHDFFLNVSFHILHIGGNDLKELPESFYSCKRHCNNLYLNNNSFSCDYLKTIEKYAVNFCQVFRATNVFYDRRHC